MITIKKCKMAKIIDGLTESQRMGLLNELMDDLKPGELDFIHERLSIGNIENTEKYQMDVARKIAEKRNNPNAVSGVVGKKLI